MDLSFVRSGFDELKKHRPLVHCILGPVSMPWAANVLLAAGAAPVMACDENEVAEFCASADALTVNFGVLTSERLSAIAAAVVSAQHLNKPCVLDPVGHYASRFRKNALELVLQNQISIIRGNASEILAMDRKIDIRGIDSGHGVEEAIRSARNLATKYHCIVVVTGPYDYITDGSRALSIGGGSARMRQVNAMGCALTCLIGAFAALKSLCPFEAAASACIIYALAGQHADERATGPGSFSVAFLDALAAIKPDDRIIKEAIASILLTH